MWLFDVTDVSLGELYKYVWQGQTPIWDEACRGAAFTYVIMIIALELVHVNVFYEIDKKMNVIVS